jgi:hypothetical protein
MIATGTLDEIMLARRQEAERLKQTRKSEKSDFKTIHKV